MKARKVTKKIAKDTKKARKPNKETQQVIDDEEIDSDFLEEAERNRPEIIDKSDSEIEETEDDKRLRLAKQILKQTKEQISYDTFQAVQYDDDKHLTSTLLEQVQTFIYQLQNRNTVYKQIAQSMNKEFRQEVYKGHLRGITCTQSDSFGKVMYSCSKDSSIIKWDLETKKKDFIQREFGKHNDGHYDEVLTLAINYDNKILASAGKDHSIKLWDLTSMKLIETLKQHRLPIYGLKFGLNSNNLASISCDRTLILWDAQARVPIDTFYGHRTEANDIDALNSDDFISVGYDRQSILWKTKFGSQMIYSGHDQSIDCVRALTEQNYCTGSIDGSIGLWNVNKRKALQILPSVHGAGRWITALGSQFNSDVLISGSYDDGIRIFQKTTHLTEIKKLPSQGIINHLDINNNRIIAVQSQEHRLGRWITDTKAKNQIVVYF